MSTNFIQEIPRKAHADRIAQNECLKIDMDCPWESSLAFDQEVLLVDHRSDIWDVDAAVRTTRDDKFVPDSGSFAIDSIESDVHTVPDEGTR